MKQLLEKVKLLNREPSEKEVSAFINGLGETVSIPLLEATLKHYKQVEKEILSKDLLEWMQENDMHTFENEDMKVSIVTYINAKIEDPEAAFEWLQKNQYGDLIKDTLDFPKGELSPEVEKYLESLGLTYSKKSGVHPQSLKKIMSDRLNSGEMLPDEDEGFKINYYDECKVKEKK